MLTNPIYEQQILDITCFDVQMLNKIRAAVQEKRQAFIDRGIIAPGQVARYTQAYEFQQKLDIFEIILNNQKFDIICNQFLFGSELAEKRKLSNKRDADLICLLNKCYWLANSRPAFGRGSEDSS